MFLTPQEIHRLTGKRRYSAQIRWLKDHGYRFSVNGLNQPVVSVAESNRKLVGGTIGRQQEPHWDSMHHG